jgi:hypothetical protein
MLMYVEFHVGTIESHTNMVKLWEPLDYNNNIAWKNACNYKGVFIPYLY